jgi:hypothetical protein
LLRCGKIRRKLPVAKFLVAEFPFSGGRLPWPTRVCFFAARTAAKIVCLTQFSVNSVFLQLGAVANDVHW